MHIYMPPQLMESNRHTCTSTRETINHHMHSSFDRIDMLFSIEAHMYTSTSGMRTLINQILNMYHACHLFMSFHYVLFKAMTYEAHPYRGISPLSLNRFVEKMWLTLNKDFLLYN
jgi:hypothetical protein